MINLYKSAFEMIDSASELKQIDELDHKRLEGMLLEINADDDESLLIFFNELIQTLDDYKMQQISERLVIGAEKIEATTDPKEKARLMVHYNNLLKELGA